MTTRRLSSTQASLISALGLGPRRDGARPPPRQVRRPVLCELKAAKVQAGNLCISDIGLGAPRGPGGGWARTYQAKEVHAQRHPGRSPSDPICKQQAVCLCYGPETDCRGLSGRGVEVPKEGKSTTRLRARGLSAFQLCDYRLLVAGGDISEKLTLVKTEGDRARVNVSSKELL